MKMCGNCGKTEHKYVDCPYIDMQFPLTKKEHAELKEKASKWDNAEVNYFPQTENALKVLRQENEEFRKLRELIEKRIKEVAPNGYIPIGRLVWTDQAMSIIKVELQKLLEDSKK